MIGVTGVGVEEGADSRIGIIDKESVERSGVSVMSLEIKSDKSSGRSVKWSSRIVESIGAVKGLLEEQNDR